jgi:hypothetical protein
MTSRHISCSDRTLVQYIQKIAPLYKLSSRGVMSRAGSLKIYPCPGDSEVLLPYQSLPPRLTLCYVFLRYLQSHFIPHHHWLFFLALTENSSWFCFSSKVIVYTEYYLTSLRDDTNIHHHHHYFHFALHISFRNVAKCELTRSLVQKDC